MPGECEGSEYAGRLRGCAGDEGVQNVSLKQSIMKDGSTPADSWSGCEQPR